MKYGVRFSNKKLSGTERVGKDASSMSETPLDWRSRLKSLILRLWYLLVGAALSSLSVAYYLQRIETIELKQERDELVVLVSRSLDVVERTRESNVECFNTLGEIRAKLGPIVEAQPKPRFPMRQMEERGSQVAKVGR